MDPRSRGCPRPAPSSPVPGSPAVQGVQRIMLGPPRPEPVGEAPEIRLVHRVQHLADSALENLVLQRRDAERPQPPVRLRYVNAPRRLRPVLPRPHPVPQGLQAGEALRARNPATSPRPRRAPRPSSGRRTTFRSSPGVTWCSSAVNRASLSFSATSRTRPSPFDTPGPALRPGRVSLSVFPTTQFLSSPASSAPCSLVRQARRYYELIRLPAPVHPGITALAFPRRPAR